MSFVGRQSTLALALATALGIALVPLSTPVEAAGLGRLSVQSALGQPLRAEVEITALNRDEEGNVTAKLASQEAFKAAGLEYNPALGSLRFAVERRADGRHFVRITSAQPINEPFVDLMVELNWPTGRFVREYTFLLDPAELRSGTQNISGGESRGETVAPPPPISGTVSAPPPLANPLPASPTVPATSLPVPTSPAPISAAPSPRMSTAQAPAASIVPATTGDGYNVVRGDTLVKIARQYKPASVTLEQAAVAIYKANPTAFLGNVNRLKANVNLSIPDEATMASVPVAEARQEIKVQSAGFNSYRSRLARTAKAGGATAAKSGQTAEGQVGASVVEGAPTLPSGDKVRITKNAGAAKAGSALGSSSAEAKAARDVAVTEAKSRVDALQKNVDDLQSLLKLKDKQLAELQDKLKAAGASGKTTSGEIGKGTSVAKVDPPKVDAPKTAAPKLDAPKVDAPKVDAPKLPDLKSTAPKADVKGLEAPKIDKPPVAANPSVPPIAVDPNDPLSKFTAPGAGSNPAATGAAKTEDSTKLPPASPNGSTPTGSIEPPKVEPPKAIDPPKPVIVAPTPTPTPAPAPERGMLDTIQEDYPFALPGLGLLALVGAGYGAYSLRRRKKAEKFEDSLIEGEAFSANSLFGTTGGQNVDTSASVLAGSTNAMQTRSETGVEVGSTEVDPIAEAEVYIAYGREAQAEEILREALRKQGDRQAIRMKLLEIYAGRRDTAAFASTAQEMFDMTRGKNEEWPRVLTLGMSIDPSNPLYTGQTGASAGAGGMQSAFSAVAAAGGGVAAVAASAGAKGSQAFSDTVDSLQAASQIVPPIPDFMAEPKYDTISPANAIDFDFGAQNTIAKAGDRLQSNQSTPSLGESTPAAKPVARSLDSLSLPDLDLPKSATKAAPRPELVTAKADEGLDFSIDLPSLEALTDLSRKGPDTSVDFGTTTTPALSTQSAAWQEMATKLDLAAAYEEIGDKDGARELLEEVVKGGDAGQQQKAKSMLSKLA